MTATATMARGPQHMEALARANKVRLARADLKRRVSLGQISAAEVILDSPWEAESMTISDLLLSQRRWGHQRARKLLLQIPMSEHKTVGSMTVRQRQALADLLGTPAAGPRRPARARVGRSDAGPGLGVRPRSRRRRLSATRARGCCRQGHADTAT